VVTPDGRRYYYHRVTRISRWERPEGDIAQRMEERIQMESKAVKEAIER
jgi:hypothetical protein